jgi:hypothetical protein
MLFSVDSDREAARMAKPMAAKRRPMGRQMPKRARFADLNQWMKVMREKSA